MSDRPDVPDEPVIRDKRRIDPVTGKVREAATAATPSAAPPGDADPVTASMAVQSAEDDTARALAELTGDLQRVHADFANYRRRVDRDREVVREQALGNVLVNLLPVLDDIGRARDHGELEGGFKAVADTLEATVGKLGMQSFGVAGEPFDPTVHEALTHGYSAEVTEPTAVTVFQVGYRIGNRVVRPARVAVAEPAGSEPAPSEREAGTSDPENQPSD